MSLPERVRLELDEALQAVWHDTDGKPTSELRVVHTVEIWPMPGGKAKRGKAAARLTAESRAALLRQLADWIEDRDDEDLQLLMAEFAEKITGRG